MENKKYYQIKYFLKVCMLLCIIFLAGCGSESSSNPKEYVIEDYTEKDIYEVRRELNKNGISNINTIDMHGNESSEIRDMLIIEQSVPAGKTITAEDSITFTIAKVNVVLANKIAGLTLDKAIDIAHSMGFDDKEIKYSYTGYSTKDITDTINRETQKDAWIATGADMQSWTSGIIIICMHGDSTELGSSTSEEDYEENMNDDSDYGEYEEEENEADDDNDEMTVYVTTYGTHYHYSKDCAGQKSAEIPLSRAIDHGMAPCSKCVH